ncbi:hypothetical protein OF829_14765 [Sphingomonas sp. LB-2]|uniref:tetratricopeptide repeat protein n=1 Tax=Sphingomonas caeni TaxID=2984949 RepID=UPI00222F43EC|nr:hypothetical protein [Sphingomonas caeni]MCW3848501.1 hypothetical protein [Sphingomonas caeni]
MRWVRLAVAFVGAGWLGYLVLCYGLAAAALNQGDARTALIVRPQSAEALSLAAEKALERNDLAGAERDARAALAIFPRDVRALRVMGMAVSLQGRRRLGSELLLRSGVLSWRDPPTQIWLIRAALDQRNYATAAQRIDAMLRGGQALSDMLRLAHGVAAIPEARAELVERMVEDPPWRSAFLADSASLPDGMEESHALVIAALRARGVPPTRAELVRFVNHLIEKNKFVLARTVWLASLEGEARTYAAGAVFDGDFHDDPAADADQPRFPFEWELDSGHGAIASLGTPPLLVNETALNVRSGDGEQRLASQILLLGPGRHVLSYATIVGGEQAPQGFFWRLSCVGYNAPIVLDDPESRTVGAWRTSTQSFEVQAANCGAQRLELVARAGGVGGSGAWFDRVGVQ